MIQRSFSPNDNLEKLAGEAQELVSEKKKDWELNSLFDKKRKLWFRSNNNSVLLEIPKFILLTTVHALVRWSTDKILAFMNQYWWGNIYKVAESAYLTCPTNPKDNPGKPVLTVSKHFRLSNGPCKVWQLDSIQLSPSQGYKYALVMVWMFSHWT